MNGHASESRPTKEEPDKITIMMQARQWEELKACFYKKEILTIRDLSSRGWAFFELGSYREALNDFQEALQRCFLNQIRPGDNSHGMFLKLGIRCAKAYLMIGQYERAITTLDQVTQKLQPIDGLVKETYEEIRTKAEKLIEIKNQPLVAREQEYKQLVELHTELQEAGLKKTHYYLVSTQWIEKWKNWTEVEQAEYPGLIDNSDLLVDLGTLPIPLRRAIDESQYYTSMVLKQEKKEKDGYFIFSKKTFGFLEERYGCKQEIKRYVIEDEERKDSLFLDVHLRMLKILMPFYNDLNLWKQKFYISISRKDSIADIEDRLKRSIEITRKPTDLVFSIWKLNDIDQEFQIIKDIDINLKTGSDEKIKIEAELLQRQKMIEECRILPEDVLLVEVREKGDPSAFENVCAEVKKETDLMLPEELKDEGDGTAILKSKLIDFSYMKKKLNFNQYSGCNGLKNIGNTCFLNSALQCMSNTEPLTRFFLTQAFAKHLNQKNKLGTGGALAVAYFRMLQDLWLDRGAVAPWEVKKEVARKAKQFMGYNQQDSSQFLNFLIDTLHQDLNTVKVKPYIEAKDSNGRPDKVVSQQYWDNFLQRNKSIMVTLMYGQLKSRLNCLTCDRISNTFDPFAILSLPIPVTLEITFRFIRRDGAQYDIMSNITDRSSFMDLITQCLRFQKQLKFESPGSILSTAVKESSAISFFFENSDTIYGHKSTFHNHELVFYDIGKQEVEGVLDGSLIPVEIRISQQGIKSKAYPHIVVVKPETTIRELRKLVFNCNKDNMVAGLKKGGLAGTEQIYQQFFGPNGQKLEPEMYDLGLLGTLKVTRNFWSKGYYCGLSDDKKLDPKQGMLLSVLKQEDMTVGDLLLLMKKKISQDSRIILSALFPNKSQFYCPQTLKASQLTDSSLSDKAKLSLEDCLNAFRTQETLDGDDKWYCSKCKKHQKALKKMDLFRLPPILVIQLKRFKQRNRGSYFWGSSCEKNSKLINFPIKELNLENYVLEGSPEYRDKKRCSYELYGVVHHMGSLYGGHYVASAKNFCSGNWLNYDDSYVQPIRSESQVVSSSAYVLFYKRKNLTFE